MVEWRKTEPDVWANRLVIIGMSQIALAAIIGAVTLDALDKPITPGLVAIASAALGLLGGMLIPRPRAPHNGHEGNSTPPISQMPDVSNISKGPGSTT